MKVHPVGDYVLFKRLKQSEIDGEASTIIIMPEGKEDSFIQVLGLVIALGDRVDQSGLTVGSKIVVEPPTATIATMYYAYEEDKIKYFLCPYHCVIGIIKEK